MTMIISTAVQMSVGAKTTFCNHRSSHKIPLIFLRNFINGSDVRTRTEINQLSVATGYKPAVLPIKLHHHIMVLPLGLEPRTDRL